MKPKTEEQRKKEALKKQIKAQIKELEAQKEELFYKWAKEARRVYSELEDLTKRLYNIK